MVVNDPNIDFVLNLTATEGGREPTPELLALMLPTYDNLNHIIRKSPRPVVLTSNTCMDLSPMARLVVERTGLHWTAGMEHGVRAIGRFLWWSEFINSTPAKTETEIPPALSYNKSFKGNWSEAQARALLQQISIPMIPAKLATSADEAIQAAHEVSLPVVLKIQSPDLPHKSDVGGVALNLADEDAVRNEFTAMLTRVRTKQPNAKIEGILVSPMRPSGIELLVGVVRDELWGLVLTVGLGGVWTEILNDTAVRILPVQYDEIEKMLDELRGASVLRGARDQEGVDFQAVSEVIYRVSMLALALGPQLNVLEINPLLVKRSHIEALDVLVSWLE